MSARINDEDDVPLVVVFYKGAHLFWTCLWVSGLVDVFPCGIFFLGGG